MIKLRARPVFLIVAAYCAALFFITIAFEQGYAYDTAPTCTQSLGPWQSAAPIPINHIEGATAVVNNQLYVFSGFYDSSLQTINRLDVYDLATDTWTQKNPMPYAGNHNNAVVDGDTIWFVGGAMGTHPAPVVNTVWRYHVPTDTWSNGPSLPAPRAAGITARYGRELHYFGGMTTDRHTNKAEHWVLNLDNPTTWVAEPNMPNARIHASGATIDGRIYAVGGQYGHDGGATDVNLLHAYNPVTNTWQARANLPIALSHFEPGTFVLNERLVIVGGRPGGGATTNLIHEYNPQTNSWRVLGTIPKKLIAPVAAVIGDKLIVTAGGIAYNVGQQETWISQITTNCASAPGTWEIVNTSNTPTARHENSFIEVGGKFYLLGGRGTKPVQIYNPATNTWTNGATPPLQLHHFQAVAMDGLIYAVNAYTGNCCAAEFGAQYVYIYDPATNLWHQGPQIPTNRQRGAAGAVVYNNKIYLVGGLQGGHGSPSTSYAYFDEYNPATGQWTPLANAPRQRDHFSAVLIGGKLYAAGGRRTSDPSIFNATIPQVDVFNFATNTWSTLPASSNLPTLRGGTSAVALGNEVVVIGGEGGGTAFTKTEALDVITGKWRALKSLNIGRHGTGAAVCNNNIYTVAGSGNQGGSPELTSMERYYLNTPTSCNTPPIVPSTLTANPASHDFGAVAIGNSISQTITLSNTSGGQGIIIKTLSISGHANFTLTTTLPQPVVIAPGKTFQLTVKFTPTGLGNRTGTVSIGHSRSTTPLQIPLTGSVADTPPIANNDSAVVALNSLVNINVLANDVDNKPFATATVNISAAPANGAAAVNPDKTVRYTPQNGFTGTDTFSYTVTDDVGLVSNSAVVTVIVTAPPNTAGENAITNSNTAVTINILSNDSDPDGTLNTASVTVTTNPARGTVTINPDGTVRYTPAANYVGADSFAYTVKDNHGIASNPATVTLTVNNQPPTANDNTYKVLQGALLTINAPGILQNDSDPENQTLGISIITNPLYSAAFNVNANGSFSYQHDGGTVSGSDSFTYEIDDDNGGKDQATVTITINRLPVAQNDAYTLAEGALLNPNAAAGVLANDSDLDAQTLTVTILTPPVNQAPGGFTLNPDGSFRYQHNGSETLSDTFQYRLSDGNGGTADATVNLTISAVNDAPKTANEAYVVVEGDTLIVAVPGVLANDSDGENDPLSASLLNAPAHGTLTFQLDGSFTYVHDGGEDPTDSFSYQVSDGRGGISAAVVNLTIDPVNDVPQAGDDVYGMLQGQTLAVPAPGVLDNDSDPENNRLIVRLISGPLHAAPGAFTLNANGSFSYAHDGSATRSDSFTYEVDDGKGGAAQAVVSLFINNLPITQDDAYTLPEGGTLTVGAANGVLNNDSDPENDPLTAAIVAPPSQAVNFTLNGDGSFSYEHDGSESLSDSFVYEADDGKGGKTQALVTLTIEPVNDAPQTTDDAYTVDEGGTLAVLTGGLLDNDSDIEGDSLTVNLISAPKHAASFTLNPDGTFDYVHTGSENPTDSFVYEAVDANGAGTQSTVTLTVNPVNDGPTAVNDRYVVGFGNILSVSRPGLLQNDTDPENNPLTATLISAPAFAAPGTFTLNADGSFTYIHDGINSQTDSFVYEISDGGLTSQAVVELLIDTRPTAAQPSLRLDITPRDQVLAPGHTALFTIALTNNGSTAFDSIHIASSLVADCNISAGSLAVGASLIFSCSEANISASFAHTLTVDAVYGAETISQSQNLTVALSAPPGALFDPPFGEKTVNELGQTELLWGFFWGNPNTNPMNARVTDPIPDGLTLIPGSLRCNTNPGGSLITNRCEVSGNQVVWEGTIFPDPASSISTPLNSLANPLIITFRTEVPPGVNQAVNRARISYDGNGTGVLDVSLASNEVSWQGQGAVANADPAPDASSPVSPGVNPDQLTLTLSASPPFAGPNDDVTFTVIVQNISSSQADNVILQSALPAEFDFISSTWPIINTNGSLIDLLIGSIAPGQTITLNFTVRVKADAGGFLNQIQVCLANTPLCASTQLASVTSLPATGESPLTMLRGTLLFAAILIVLMGLRRVRIRRG